MNISLYVVKVECNKVTARQTVTRNVAATYCPILPESGSDQKLFDRLVMLWSATHICNSLPLTAPDI